MFILLLLVSFSSCKKIILEDYDFANDGPWFYSQLTKYQKPFYEALEYWRTNNLLTGAPMMFLDSDGNLTNHVEEDLLKLYVMGKSSAVNTHFLSAIAAWRYDHPEIFYVDVSKLMYRISQDSAHNFHILFGCLSQPSLLFDYIEQDKVSEMISNLNSKIQEMVNSATQGNNISEKVIAVHNYIKSTVTYKRQYQIEDEEADKRNHVYSSYGALVNHVAMCDGFAKAFQTAMIQLNIPSIQVPGDALDENGATQTHSWNLVQLENKEWFVVDTTYDTTSKTDNWLLATQESILQTHFPNGQLDAQPVTFYFPPIPYVSSDLWTIDFTYTEDNKVNQVLVSFKGKNSTALLEDGYRYVYKQYGFDAKEGVYTVQEWMDLRITFKNADQEENATDYNESFSSFTPQGNIGFLQIGVTYTNITRFKGYYCSYEQSLPCYVNESDVIFSTQMIPTNYSYKNYSMFADMLNPSVQYYYPFKFHYFPGYEYDFQFLITEDLMSTDPEDGIGNFSNFSITLTAVSGNEYDRLAGKQYQIGEEAVKMTTITNLRIVENKFILCTMKPSAGYAHDFMHYTFNFNGVVGIYSQKPILPWTFLVRFFPNNGGTNTCGKQMGSGTIYVGARPVLITNGDIRNNGENDDFEAGTEDETVKVSGKGATTHDLALVATRAECTSEVVNRISPNSTNECLEYEEFTATFNIALSLYCKDWFIYPNKWNCPLTVQLPFPDGFDPEKYPDVSFEVIHYKGDGVEEHNTVVVGATGLLITVQSFSPFRIQPRSKSSSLLASNIYPLFITAIGASPNVTIQLANGTTKNALNIVSDYEENNAILLTIPEQTRVERIFLNGKEFEIISFSNFTLPQELLNQKSNNLEIYFSSFDVLNMEYENKLSVHHVTVDVAAKTQTTENKQIDELLTKTSGSPSAQNSGFVAPDTEINFDDIIPEVDNKDLPPIPPLIKPNENPYSPPKIEPVPAESPSEPSEPSEPLEPSEPSEPSGSGSGSSDSGSPKSSLGPGPIAGIVIAVVAVIAIALILIYIFVIKPKRESSTSNAGEVKSAVENNEVSTGL